MFLRGLVHHKISTVRYGTGNSDGLTATVPWAGWLALHITVRAEAADFEGVAQAVFRIRIQIAMLDPGPYSESGS